MNAEPNTKSVFTPRIGFVATLSSLFTARGSAAPSRAYRARGVRIPLALAGVVCVLLALGSAPAFAERAALPTITEANGASFITPAAVAVDSSNNLWVADDARGAVFKLSSSGGFVAESSGVPWTDEAPVPVGVAFSNASQQLYGSEFFASDIWALEPSGAFADIDFTGPWSGGFQYVRIAADNSSGSTSGDLYVAGESGSVYRVDSAGGEAQFSASEPYITGNQITGFGLGESFSGPVAGLAVDAAGDLYVADAGRDAIYEFKPSGEFVQAFTEAAGKPFGSVSAVAVDPTNGHLLLADPTDGVIDEFESSTGAYLDNVEEVGEPRGIAVDSTGTLYVAQGSVVDVYGPYTPPTHRPEIANGAPLEIALTGATLNATVNPKGGGEVSECRFEYGSTESLGESVPCAPATFSSTTAVSGALSGLQPGVLYYYRVHVVDPITGPGGSAGPVGAFRTFAPNPAYAGAPAADCPNPVHSTGPSAALPDCRAYELVTPADKGTGEDMFGGESQTGAALDNGFAAEDGDGFFLNTAAAFGPSPAAGQNHYVFSRGSAGWQMASLAAPGGGVQTLKETILSQDFSHVAMNYSVGTNHTPGEREANVIGPSGGPYTSVFEGGGEPVGASSDLSRVFFSSTDHGYAAPAEEQLPGTNALYEYSEGRYSLVNVNSQGGLLNRCGASAAGSGGAYGLYDHNVSADGSRVFFTSAEPGAHECDYEENKAGGFTGAPPQLYVREGGRTIEVSAPENGVVDPGGPQPVAFAGASADGSRVFFITRAELTADDVGNHDPELYEYDVETQKLTRVSRGDSASAVGNVGWVVPSEDGSTVYFTALGVLAPGAATGSLVPGTPTEGVYNLYRYDTGNDSTTYIATVSGGDWSQGDLIGGHKFLNIASPNSFHADWETTPDGRYLLFESREDLTGYNDTGDSEIYRYDAADGSLICVSCNPSGVAPTADASFERNALKTSAVRAISDDGAYAFFDTPESLSSTATNGRLNVYEWHEGAISLISSGQDAANAYFLGAGATGADVFFGTHARLVPQDTDDAGDLYDARIDGGFPVLQGSAACEGDACQSPPAPPVESTPASLTFTGPGNLVTPAVTPSKPVVKKKAVKCAKGKTRNRKGQCVRKKTKKTSNKRGAKR